jgi:hypothetical protein
MWSALFEHCRANGGPVQIRAASAATGVPASAIRSRARREGWWQPHRDVTAPPGTPVDGRRWGLAALARCTGPDPNAPRPVALARWSGLAALGIRQTWPTAAQVVVPTTRAPRPGRRLAVVRWGGFDVGRDAEQVDGLRVLRPPGLLRSLAPVADVDVLIEVLIDLVQKRLVTLDQIADDLVEHPLTPGRGRIEQALARLGAAGRTDSPPELQLRERLTAAGIPLDVGQVAVPCVDGVTIHFDLGVAAICFGIDLDSMLAHSHRTQLRSDVRRSNQVTRISADWRVLRATVEDVGASFGAFADLAREVIAAQSLRHLGVPWPRPTDLAG